jgi:hypothetical protein
MSARALAQAVVPRLRREGPPGGRGRAERAQRQVRGLPGGARQVGATSRHTPAWLSTRCGAWCILKEPGSRAATA